MKFKIGDMVIALAVLGFLSVIVAFCLFFKWGKLVRQIMPESPIVRWWNWKWWRTRGCYWFRSCGRCTTPTLNGLFCKECEKAGEIGFIKDRDSGHD